MELVEHMELVKHMEMVEHMELVEHMGYESETPERYSKSLVKYLRWSVLSQETPY